MLRFARNDGELNQHHHRVLDQRFEFADYNGAERAVDRAVDGALGAVLIGAFKALIESPVMMLV